MKFIVTQCVSSHLKSMRVMCVTRDLPVPQGSIRKWDASSTALKLPSSSALGCSTEKDTMAQAPFGRSVVHDLCKNNIRH